MFKQTITSLQNPLVKHLVKLRQNPKYRLKENSVLISGFKLVREIAKSVSPKKIFVTEETKTDLPGERYIVSTSLLKKISGLPSPEPIAAEFPLPSPSNLETKAPLLVLDAINDPGNLGTVVRTALALDWKGVFFLSNCVDPFHEKVIRASRGALFSLPWMVGSWEVLTKLKEKKQLVSYIADIQGTPCSELPPKKNILLILSNEAQGLSEKGAAFGEKITIPMKGEMESLNVAIAGAILMYELLKS